jgi:hypothetical protein
VSDELWERLQAMAKGYPSTISHAQALEAVQWAAEEIKRLRALCQEAAGIMTEDYEDGRPDAPWPCHMCQAPNSGRTDIPHTRDCLIERLWKAAGPP